VSPSHQMILPLARDDFTAAQFLVQEFGADAELRATMRIDVLTEQADLAGVSRWRCILRALGILRGFSAGGEPLH
jgi:hypothetical protein